MWVYELLLPSLYRKIRSDDYADRTERLRLIKTGDISRDNARDQE